MQTMTGYLGGALSYEYNLYKYDNCGEHIKSFIDSIKSRSGFFITTESGSTFYSKIDQQQKTVIDIQNKKLGLFDAYTYNRILKINKIIKDYKESDFITIKTHIKEIDPNIELINKQGFYIIQFKDNPSFNIFNEHLSAAIYNHGNNEYGMHLGKSRLNINQEEITKLERRYDKTMNKEIITLPVNANVFLDRISLSLENIYNTISNTNLD